MSGKPSKFTNASFHREGRDPSRNQQAKPAQVRSNFIQELVETGRADWKKAPVAIKKRYNGLYMVFLSIPVIILSSYEMYRRLEGKSTKKVQEGEIIDGHMVRKFDEKEKWEVEEKSLMYKIFGKDFFLDGFTSKTMNKNASKKEDND